MPSTWPVLKDLTLTAFAVNPLEARPELRDAVFKIVLEGQQFLCRSDEGTSAARELLSLLGHLDPSPVQWDGPRAFVPLDAANFEHAETQMHDYLKRLGRPVGSTVFRFGFEHREVSLTVTDFYPRVGRAVLVRAINDWDFVRSSARSQKYLERIRSLDWCSDAYWDEGGDEPEIEVILAEGAGGEDTRLQAFRKLVSLYIW